MKKVNTKSNRKVMDAGEINKLFLKLAKGKESMSDDDLFDFIEKDLGLKAEDPLCGHIVTNIMGIKKIEEITLQNMQNLFKNVKASSVKQLQQIIRDGELHTELARPDIYKLVYKKLFDVYSGKYTTLDFEVAELLWDVYLKGKFNYFNEFKQFLASHEKIKIHRDLWNMMYEFATEVKNLNKDYKPEDGWPVFIDKFVEYLKSKGK